MELLVILVAFSVLNTQLMSVLERTREFGITMALGLKPLRLGSLVMLESVIMGLVGLAIGAGVGFLIVVWLGDIGISFEGMEELAADFNMEDRIYPAASMVSIFAGPGVVFLFTVLAALYPAFRLRLLQPVEAMRVA